MQALQQATNLGTRPGLNMPSTHSMLAQVPEQPTSARAPLAGSLFPTPAMPVNMQKTPSLAVNGAAGAQKSDAASTVGGDAAGTGVRRQATPATGVVHVPCDEMECEEDKEEEEGLGGMYTAAADAAHGGALFGPPGPARTSASGRPELLATQGHAQPVDLVEGGQIGPVLTLPSPVDDAETNGAVSMAHLLVDDAGVASASPGHSSISFGSPVRSTWGGFATPGRCERFLPCCTVVIHLTEFSGMSFCQ